MRDVSAAEMRSDKWEEEYREYMMKVNFFVESSCGMSVSDLPDCPFADWFEAGESALQAATMCVNNAFEGVY